jgi:hypothetical protein
MTPPSNQPETYMHLEEAWERYADATPDKTSWMEGYRFACYKSGNRYTTKMIPERKLNTNPKGIIDGEQAQILAEAWERYVAWNPAAAFKPGETDPHIWGLARNAWCLGYRFCALELAEFMENKKKQS